jgi:fumarylacetoacetase
MSSGFGLENLPFCRFGEPARLGVRYGASIIDLSAIWSHLPRTLNELFERGRDNAVDLQSAVRKRLAQGSALPSLPIARQPLHMPFQIPNFVDFYSSREHAENVGRLFRDPANPLPENWLHLPSGYNGRAGNVVLGGVPVTRPSGQYKNVDGQLIFAPTAQLDFELELGCFLSPNAPDHIAGFVLLNDWSARDIQRWEYVPLGPFLSKAFATSISPWVILPESLAPFQVPGPAQDPLPFPHLQMPEPRNYDIEMEAHRNGEPCGASNYRDIYWSFRQQLAHLKSAGVRLQTGDLIGSGTISGALPNSEGSLLERGGPFLADGETITLSARARNDNLEISFGELTTVIAPA